MKAPSVIVDDCHRCGIHVAGCPDWQNRILCAECRWNEHTAWWPDHQDDPYVREEM